MGCNSSFVFNYNNELLYPIQFKLSYRDTYCMVGNCIVTTLQSTHNGHNTETGHSKNIFSKCQVLLHITVWKLNKSSKTYGALFTYTMSSEDTAVKSFE